MKTELSAGADPGNAGSLQFHVLGPVAVVAGTRELALGGVKQRTVLALLIAGAGGPVSADALIAGVYGDDASGGARRTIHTYVSNLRRELGDVIVASGKRYTLDIETHHIDAARFRKLYEEGSQLIESSPGRAATLLREALGLWRGHAYADVEAHSVLEAETIQLGELRLAALEARVNADLALGLHRDLIGELEALIGEYPLQEGFRQQQMMALYRSGRQSEALRAFARAQDFLGEELGIAPSPELQELEQLILVQDPALELRVRAVIERRAILAAELDEGFRFASTDEVDAALARRNETLRAKAATSGGSVLDVRGTAVYAAFRSVGDAIDAARSVVDTTAQVAIDYGDVEVGETGASGAPIIRALRLAAVGHPGQVLIAENAHTELAAERTGGWSVAALGLQTIRGQNRPVQVFQLVGEGLSRDFPTLRVDRLPPPLPTGIPGLVAGYELRAELGGGVTGVVHRAYQPTVGREVAIRVVRPELVGDPRFVRRFEAEAQRLAAIEHPHLVPLIDYWREPDGAFLVHRLMRGPTLLDKISGGRVPPGEVLALVDQVGSAVAAGHARGVSHGRIRPQNVFLDDEGYVYVADMGLAAMFVGMASAAADAYTAPEAIGGPATTAGDIYGLGVLVNELLSRDAGSHDRGLPTLGTALESLIARATHPQPRQRHRSVHDFLEDLAAAIDPTDRRQVADVRSEARNPYKGLAAFQEADAPDFHGRSDLTAELVGAVQARTFTLVAGPSGIGKSSVVRAGLVPRFRSDSTEEGSNWVVTDMFPGARPFDELEAAIARVALQPIGHSIEAVRSGTHTLAANVSGLLPVDTRLLLIIDQFEELFTHNCDEATRQRFLETLTDVAGDAASPVHVVATMRADFLDRPLGYPEFGRLLTESTIMVPGLDRKGLAEVVQAPAATVGVVMGDALVEALAADAHAEPGALPLLQHTLTELFHDRTSDQLSVDDYRAKGGLAGAIQRRAEVIYGDLNSTDQATTNEIFLRLVSVNPDSEDTRRRVRMTELDQLAVAPESIDRVLEAFGRHRLLVFDRDPTTRGPTVEVAHEALITHWSRLAKWIEAAREDLLVARRLDSAFVEWDNSDRDPSYLLAGARLEQAADWRIASRIRSSSDVEELIDASLAHNDQIAAQRRGRRRAVLGGFAAAAAMAIVLAGAAWAQRGDAIREARVTDAQALVLEAERSVNLDPELSMLLALEAIDAFGGLGDIPGRAVTALRQGLAAQRVTARVPGGGFVTTDPSGSTFATQATNGDIAIWDIASMKLSKTIAIEAGAAAVGGRFLSATDLVVFIEHTASNSLEVRLVDLETTQWDRSFALEVPDLDETVWSFDVSPDGAEYVFSRGPLLQVFDARTREELFEATQLPAPTPTFSGASTIAYTRFVPEENRRVSPIGCSSCGESEFVIADARTGVVLQTASDLTYDPLFAAFSPDGSRLAYVGEDSGAVIDVETGVEMWAHSDFQGAGPPLWLWRQNGFIIGTEALVAVVDAASGQVTRRIAANNGGTGSYQLVPRTNLVATAGVSDGQTLLIDLAVAGQVELDRFASPIATASSARLSPHGETIFVQDSDEYALIDTGAGITLLDFRLDEHSQTDQSPAVASRNGAWIAGPSSFTPFTLNETEGRLDSGPTAQGWDDIRAVSGDGSLLAIAAEDGGSRIVRTGDYRTVANLNVGGNPDRFTASFSSGDAYLATNNHDAPSSAPVIRVWRVDTGGLLTAFGSADGFVGSAVEFTSDDQRLILGGADGAITIFDFTRLRDGVPAGQAVVRRIQAHDDAIVTVRVSADDSMVASSAFGEPAKLWDLETGASLGEFGSRGLTAVDFHPIQPWLYVVDSGSVTVHTLDLIELIGIAGSRLTRAMTEVECQQHLGRACDR